LLLYSGFKICKNVKGLLSSFSLRISSLYDRYDLVVTRLALSLKGLIPLNGKLLPFIYK